MKESPGPHGFYDGPLKVLAAGHLGLIRAIFFLFLVSLPGAFLCGAIAQGSRACEITVKRHYPPESTGGYTVRPARVEVFTAGFHNYDQWPADEFVEARVFGFATGLGVCQSIYRGLNISVFGFALMGAGLLLYRFYRLAKLLYPQLAFYFTLLVLVPFLNLIVILLLLWNALRQMRRLGLRVGIFGIDPARFG